MTAASFALLGWMVSQAGYAQDGETAHEDASPRAPLSPSSTNRDCGVVSVGEIGAAADRVQTAYGALDLVGLRAARESLLFTLSCAHEPLGVNTAAKVHLAMALGAFVDGDQPRAQAALGSLLVVLPAYQFPSAWGGASHPLVKLLQTARETPPGTPTTIRLPYSTFIRLDGVRTNERFSGRAALAQVFRDDGVVVWTGYAWPDDELPPDLPRTAISPQARVARGMFVVGGASLAAGITTGALALSMEGQRRLELEQTINERAEDPIAARAEYFQDRRQVNTLSTAAGITLAAGAIGLTAGVVLVWPW